MRVTPNGGLRGARRFLNASDEEVPEASYRDLADLAGVLLPATLHAFSRQWSAEKTMHSIL
jgi:hypothetical protein